MSLGMTRAKVRQDGRPIWYHTDGTGRDTYITRNNGGLMSQQMIKNMECKEKLPDFIQFRSASSKGFRKSLPQLSQKFVHYHSNGTGRDSYIGWNNGGITGVYSAKKNNTEIAFRTNLRTYTRTPSQTQFFNTGAATYTSGNTFDFTNSNLYLNTKQVEEQNKVHKRQIQSAHRLSRPKTAYGPNQNPFSSCANQMCYQVSDKENITN